MIPKGLAESVPISVEKELTILDHHNKNQGHLENDEVFNAVYFDDDKYLRMAWESAARKNNIKILTLASTQNFFNYAERVAKDADIYIDRELGQGEPKGEIWAKELYERGYKNLFLATGYSPEIFQEMPWIKAIRGKQAPWDDEEI